MEQVVSNDDASNSKVEKDLEWELANVENVCSTPRCMYKVPQILYDANKEAYTPKVVTIGPYHYGRKNLLSMHSMKIRYLQSFLKRSGLELGTFVKMAQGWEKEVRGYYDEECDLNSDELVHMILLDGIFIVEFTHQWYAKRGSNGDDLDSSGRHLFMEESSLKDDIMRDLTLLENQLPFFVLKGLGDHSSPPGDGNGDDHGWMLNLTKLLVDHFDLIPTEVSNRHHHLIAGDFREYTIMHLVDFIHFILCKNSLVRQVYHNAVDLKFYKTIAASLKVAYGPWLQLSRSATELQEAGVKLECAPDLIFTDIAFNENGVLLIPPLEVNRDTESLFRNLIAYEQCHRKDNTFRSYVILMDCLINTSQDVQLLVDSGIINNCLGEIGDVCTLFNNLYKMPMMDSTEFQFMSICRRLNSYSRDPWHKWKATWFRWKLILKRDYFSNPWSLFSVIAAIILLGLTIIQTLCSIKGVEW